MTIIYKTEKNIDIKQLKRLYEDVGWYAYTDDLKILESAVKHSLDVITAWEGDKLIGLIRVVGDGLTIIYVQDILVLNSYQNRGIASTLLQNILDKYSKVGQTVLLTDEAPNVRRFYEKNQFESCDQGNLVSFVLLR